MWETDHKLNLTYVSDRVAEALKTPPAELIGRHLFTIGEFEESLENGPARPDLAAALMPFRGRIFLMPDHRHRMRRISMTGVHVYDERSGVSEDIEAPVPMLHANMKSNYGRARLKRFLNPA